MKKYHLYFIKEKEIDPEKFEIFSKYLKKDLHVIRADFEGDVEDVFKRKEKLAKLMDELSEKYGDVIGFLKTNMEKHNIGVLEALALFARNCEDGSLLYCDHCIENKSSFVSLKQGWLKYCSDKCSKKRLIKNLRDLSREERLETVRVKKEHNLSSFEEARYFIEKQTKGYCKVCKRPTKFINYLKGYKSHCSYCEKRFSKKTKIKERPNLGDLIKETKQKMAEYGDTCYEMITKYQLKKLSQASWHLSRNDHSCTYGCCVNCGKRFVFISYNQGYHSSNSCRCNQKKIVNIIRRPLSLQKYYERSFLIRVNNSVTFRNINDEIIRKIQQKPRIKTEEEIKRAREKFIMQQIERWGAERRKNPILFSKTNRERVRYGENFIKSKLKEEGYDPQVYDLSNDPNWWYQIYVVDEMTIDEISYYTGLSKYIITNRLKKFGIIKNTFNEFFEEEDDEYHDLMMPIF